MSPSKKLSIIEKLFFDKWNAQTQSFKGSPIVTLKEIGDAIRWHNKQNPDDKLSDRNPANFFKDFIRNRASANANWPQSVWQEKYTARQTTGGGNVFEFIKAPTDQSEPFPSFVHTYPRDPNAPRHSLQSVSLPILARLFGQQHETWLTQVAVQLYLIETHLAFQSDEFLHVSHLQSGIKQANTEIDALYLGEKHNGDELVITVEAKGRRDDILEEQILAQVHSVLRMPKLTGKKAVLPMAMKIIGTSLIYIVTYHEIPFKNPIPNALSGIASEAIYELRPPVPGILCL